MGGGEGNVRIRRATPEDCLDIARLANLAGEGIPAYFWAQRAAPGEPPERAGARRAADPDANFSYRNAHLAELEGRVAGMLLAYRLPEDMEADGDPDAVPAFIRPMIELERQVPGSFYVNMLAVYPAFRSRGVGLRLMALVDALAVEAGCGLSSLGVFEQNAGALRLYRRLGYRIADRRPVVPHESHPHTGDILLLTRPVPAPAGR